MELDSKPAELDDLDRKIAQLKIEQMALKKETDSTSKARLTNINEELKSFESEAKALTEKWQKEKKELLHFKEMKKSLDQKRFELEKSYNEGNYKLASELQYSIIPSLEKDISEYQNRSKDNHLLSESVDEENICLLYKSPSPRD